MPPRTRTRKAQAASKRNTNTLAAMPLKKAQSSSKRNTKTLAAMPLQKAQSSSKRKALAAMPLQSSKRKKSRHSSPTPQSSSSPEAEAEASPPPSPPRSNRPNHFRNIKLCQKNDVQMARYERLKYQGIKNPRHLHIDSLKRLDLLVDVQTLTDRIGIWELLQRLSQTPTYIRPAFEFLSSVTIDHDDNITFRLLGEYRGITVQKLNTLLNTPTQGIRETPNIDEFWFEISGEKKTKKNKHLKTLKIQHPAIRYIQRLLANTIFPRGESAVNAKIDELFFIQAMMSPSKLLLDVGYFIIKHAIDLAQMQKGPGHIVFGAVVTIIAAELGVDLTGEQLASGPPRLDYEALKSYGLVRTQVSNNNQHSHLLANGVEMKFPLPHVNIHDKSTWLLIKPGSQASSADDRQPREEGEHHQQPQLSLDLAPPQPQPQPHTYDQVDPHAEILAYLERLDGKLGRIEDKLDGLKWMNIRYYNWALQRGMPYEEPPQNLFGEGFFANYPPPPFNQSPPPPDDE